MKTRIYQMAVATAVFGGLALLAMKMPAQDASSNTTVPQMTYAVSEIVKLAQAKVGEDTIIAYIKGSGNSYALDAAQIIYLRQQGVSDEVLTLMLNQPKLRVSNGGVPLPTTPAPPPVVATATVQPTVTYVQTVPTTYYYDQPYYDYYYPAYSYCYPAGYYNWCYPGTYSFSCGGYWGGSWRGGGWHGGVGNWHGGIGGWHGSVGGWRGGAGIGGHSGGVGGFHGGGQGAGRR